MVKLATEGSMAGMQKEESLQGPQGTEPCVLAEASQAQAAALNNKQVPKPQVQALSSSAAAVGKMSLRQSCKRDLIRSLGRRSRGSGNWEVSCDTAQLSIGRGSTRRRGLKEILLQSSGAEGAMWFATAQKIAAGGSSSSSTTVGIPQELEQKVEQSPEDLSLVLDPLEHEWMLTVAQGDPQGILRLLEVDPSLLARRDFVTGFTALHWLAKHGDHEALIEVMTCAEKKGYHADVNVPTASGGLTPLHLAALQGHEMVIKVLVGAYGANTSLRDHSGHKAWQYLKANASRELKELSGALEEDLAQLGAWNTNNNCKPSGRSGYSGAEKNMFSSMPSLRSLFRQALSFFQDL